MPLTVREQGDVVATYRYVAVSLMECLARWVPTTPELEAKALFGRHIWDFAQHADQFGYRTHELRLALQHSRPPVQGYKRVLENLDAITRTPDRIAVFYDAVLPDLEQRYRAYLIDADPLLDEPTIRILERALSDFSRMLRDRDQLLTERPDLAPEHGEETAALVTGVNSIAKLVDYRPSTDAAAVESE
ncbi:MAG: hypothetical protein ACE5HT_02765 [Gemmatimonadales bacterium]